jgi:hypothetical protein
MLGVQCARMGHTSMKVGSNPSMYAMAWSASANDQLIDEVQAQYERKPANPNGGRKSLNM